ncbi:unnamed protein product [Caenorhabditis auriculariae]|uniref:SANT domain-containing protein n=1 Tax=Caenorhabditis auriculariae TaxID=2777116 RepID=A0A8S1GUP2_9PELO|nr:unnamed protein product [Caenorhabditis auriculariae]
MSATKRTSTTRSSSKKEEEPKYEDEEQLEMDEDSSAAPSETRESSEVPPAAQRRSNRQRIKRKRSDSDSNDEDTFPGDRRTTGRLLSKSQKTIQVGDEHQAKLNEEDPTSDESFASVDSDRDELIWTFPENLDPAAVDNFCENALVAKNMPIDRSLFILMKSKYNFDIATDQLEKRRWITDEWTPEEENLFKTAFYSYGKRFDRIRALIPYRPMASIIQHYYNTKKEMSYKSSIDAKMADLVDDDDTDSEDELEYVTGACEHCAEKVSRLEENHLTGKMECTVCVTYMKMTKMPRPVNLRSTIDNVRQSNCICPTVMQSIADDFLSMARILDEDGNPIEDPSDSDSKQDVEEMVRAGAPLYDEHEKREEPRKEQPDPEAGSEEATPEKVVPNVSVVRRRKTVCMKAIEETKKMIERKHFENAQLERVFRRVKYESLKASVAAAKERMDRIFRADDEITGTPRSFSRSYSKVSPTWSEKERGDALLCFMRYGENFAAVAEVIGTKSVDMIRSFYSNVKADLEHVVKKLDEEIETKAPKLEPNDVIRPVETIEMID